MPRGRGRFADPDPPAHPAGGPEAAQDRLQPPRTHPGRGVRLSRAGARVGRAGEGGGLLGAAERGRPGGRGQSLGLPETLPGPGALRGDPPGLACPLRPAPTSAGRSLRPQWRAVSRQRVGPGPSRALGWARDVTVWHPADCWGDIGAATGAALLAFGAFALHEGFAPTPELLVWAGSEGGRGRLSF